MPITYSEYSSLVDILENSENPSENTYGSLMEKEKNVLATVNHVVNSIKDKDIQSRQFVDLSVSDIAQNFFLEWPKMIKDLLESKSKSELYQTLTKQHRTIYWGVLFITIGLFLFFIDSTSPKIMPQ